MVTYIKGRGDRNLRNLVDLEGGVVNREVYVNEDIYSQELEQIFGRAWLLVGHESQVENPGDFVLGRMGEEEVILTRDRKGKIHVFLNTCRHRGMKVCRYDDGNALVFTCPFHAWTYDTDGRLVGVPHHKDAYFEELDKSQWASLKWRRCATTMDQSGLLGTPRRHPLRTTWGPSSRRCGGPSRPPTARTML